MLSLVAQEEEEEEEEGSSPAANCSRSICNPVYEAGPELSESDLPAATVSQ